MKMYSNIFLNFSYLKIIFYFSEFLVSYMFNSELCAKVKSIDYL